MDLRPSLIIACLLAVMPGSSASADVPVLNVDFMLTTPQAAGWTALGGATSGGGVATAGVGQHWLSPSFAVTPGQYYKLSYTSSAATKGYVSVLSTNGSATFDREPAGGSNGVNPLVLRAGQLLSDNYTSLPPSASLASNVSYFRAPSQASQSFVGFNGITLAVNLASVSVATATDAEVVAWADGLLSGPLGGVRPATPPPADRYATLNNTFTRLRDGQPLSVAMVGDSIVADTLNSTFDVLVERRSGTSATVQVLEATGHGTGMAAWDAPDATWQQAGLKLGEAVIDRSPDLVIIGGISNGGAQNLSATAAVIDRIRLGSPAGHQPEILLMTGPAYAGGTADLNAYRDALSSLAEAKGVAFFDFNGTWRAYVDELMDAGLTIDALQRDGIHNSDLGKQVLGRVMEGYFATPVPEPSSPFVVAIALMAATSISGRRRAHRRPPR